MPPKFGTIIKLDFREGIYPIKEKIYALKNPDVIHFMTKTLRNWFHLYGSDKWWEYARKTNFFNEINMNFPIHQENKQLITKKISHPKNKSK